MSDQPTSQANPRSALRRIALVSALLLAVDLLDVAGVVYHKHGHFPAEEWFGSYAAIGIGACVLAGLAAWLGHALRARGGARNA